MKTQRQIRIELNIKDTEKKRRKIQLLLPLSCINPSSIFIQLPPAPFLFLTEDGPTKKWNCVGRGRKVIIDNSINKDNAKSNANKYTEKQSLLKEKNHNSIQKQVQFYIVKKKRDEEKIFQKLQCWGEMKNKRD